MRSTHYKTKSLQGKIFRVLSFHLSNLYFFRLSYTLTLMGLPLLHNAGIQFSQHCVHSVLWITIDIASVWWSDTGMIIDHPEWGTSLMKDSKLSCITWYRSEACHPPTAIFMHNNGANAFKAATLLQLTVEPSLHHLFSVRQISKTSARLL